MEQKAPFRIYARKHKGTFKRENITKNAQTREEANKVVEDLEKLGYGNIQIYERKKVVIN